MQILMFLSWIIWIITYLPDQERFSNLSAMLLKNLFLPAAHPYLS